MGRGRGADDNDSDLEEYNDHDDDNDDMTERRKNSGAIIQTIQKQAETVRKCYEMVQNRSKTSPCGAAAKNMC